MIKPPAEISASGFNFSLFPFSILNMPSEKTPGMFLNLLKSLIQIGNDIIYVFYTN